MNLRSSLAVAGVTAAILASVAGCGSGTSSTPTVPASAAPTPTTAPSTAASSEPSASTPTAQASNSAPGGDAPDAATLLTADIAGSIIGGSPQKVTTPFSVPGISVASYGNADGDAVTMFVEAVPGGMVSVEMQAAIAMAGAQGDLVTVTGIGDAAGKVVAAHEATVAFVKGTNLVVVGATSGNMTGSDLEPKVEDAARQIASRL